LQIWAGELLRWYQQVPIDLNVAGEKICAYIIGFLEIDSNGGEMKRRSKCLRQVVKNSTIARAGRLKHGL